MVESLSGSDLLGSWRSSEISAGGSNVPPLSSGVVVVIVVSEEGNFSSTCGRGGPDSLRLSRKPLTDYDSEASDAEDIDTKESPVTRRMVGLEGKFSSTSDTLAGAPRSKSRI